MKRFLSTFVALGLVAAAACGDSDPTGDPKNDPRCTAMCATDDPACFDDQTYCLNTCGMRLLALDDACSSCLAEPKQMSCSPGMPCCPKARFAKSVLDCKAVCGTYPGVPAPDPHPTCQDYCRVSDAACSASETSCLKECQELVQGSTGLCASCLLDGVHRQGSGCQPGAPCCLSTYFQNTKETCAAFCAG